jgi:5-methylcytosine-specific restriction protein A
MPNRIPGHRPARLAPVSRHSEYDRLARDPDGKRFYNSDVWRRLRRSKLRKDPLCERCLKKDLLVPASIAHHTKERREFPDLALDIDLLESLCASCHSAEHAQG